MPFKIRVGNKKLFLNLCNMPQATSIEFNTFLRNFWKFRKISVFLGGENFREEIVEQEDTGVNRFTRKKTSGRSLTPQRIIDTLRWHLHVLSGGKTIQLNCQLDPPSAAFSQTSTVVPASSSTSECFSITKNSVFLNDV